MYILQSVFFGTLDGVNDFILKGYFKLCPISMDFSSKRKV